MEYRPIPALAVLMPAGTKLLLVNPAVRRGMLLLQKENVVLLGGQVGWRTREKGFWWWVGGGGGACWPRTLLSGIQHC